MSSDSVKGAPLADCSKNPEMDRTRMGTGFDRSSITVPDGQCTRTGTAEEALAILQYYVMVFILGIEGHLPECHWTHNVLVYLPVCFSAFPYLFLCMYFTEISNKDRVAKITSRIVDQSFANAFTFVAIKLGRNDKCGSGVRLWNRFTAVVLFCGTCLVNYFRLRELVEVTKARANKPAADCSPNAIAEDTYL